MLRHPLRHVQVQSRVEHLLLGTELGRGGAGEELVAGDVDHGGHEEHDDFGGGVGRPQQRHHGEVDPVGAQDHVAVELDGLLVLGGNLLGPSRPLLALFLGKFSHWTRVHDAGGGLNVAQDIIEVLPIR